MTRDNNLILSCSSLSGTKVKNEADETVGHIKDLMIDVNTGEVMYAVLSVDTGFLNLESKYFAVPLQSMRFDTDRENAVMDISKERLESSPGFDKNDWPDYPQVKFIDEVYSYYGVTQGESAV